MNHAARPGHAGAGSQGVCPPTVKEGVCLRAINTHMRKEGIDSYSFQIFRKDDIIIYSIIPLKICFHFIQLFCYCFTSVTVAHELAEFLGFR